LLREMDELYPAGSIGSEYAALAGIYRDGFALGGAPEACRLVQDQARGQEAELLGPLGSSVFGYANPDYTLVDLCR
ncbi:MAG: hypothetical protein R3335_13520, partial [Anaerolineales bacterium]|nr:hypothetical protein [Anaerolineales bacterium]